MQPDGRVFLAHRLRGVDAAAGERPTLGPGAGPGHGGECRGVPASPWAYAEPAGVRCWSLPTISGWAFS